MLPEFKNIFDLLKAFPNEQSCIDHLETLRWSGDVVSPFKFTSKVYKCAGNKYKCTTTGKYFNVKTNTIFDNTKIPLQKWFMAWFIFSSHKKGISSHQLGRDITVTQKSAWFMLHRLRYAVEHNNYKEALCDTVEIDETHMGGQAKNKHENKKSKDPVTGGTLHEQTPVLGMLERGEKVIVTRPHKVIKDKTVKEVVITKLSKVIAVAVPDKTKETLLPLIVNTVMHDSNIMTDEFMAYRSLSVSYNHATVCHSAKEYVNGMAHTNGIESFWSHLKRGVDGIYHWVSVPHLQSYVSEFAFRFNTRKDTTQDRFNYVLSGIDKTRLTYNKLIGK